MTVHDRECPNCGAAVDFGSSTQATCSFCRSALSLFHGTIKSHSELNDLLEGTPVRRNEFTPTSAAPQPLSSTDSQWADFSDVADLARRGRAVEAVQLYRGRTGVGVNEARYIVEALALQETPASLQARIPSRSGRFALLGCLSMLFFAGLCAAFVVLSSQVAFRVWGPLDETLQIINNDFQVKQIFGQPLTPGLFVTGKISGDSKSSVAHFRVPIYGPRRSGELRGSGIWRKGVWDLNIWMMYDDDGEEQTISITHKVN